MSSPTAHRARFRFRSSTAMLAAIVATCAATAAHAQRESGINLTPESARYLISKDVGSERWAITYNLEDRTVTGNVFSTAGSAPQFVWCTTTSVEQAADPAAAQYNLRCQFAGSCGDAPCNTSQWEQSAPVDVTVQGSFLLPRNTRSTLAGNVQPIFSASCANSDACHAANRAPDLLPGRSWNATFEVPAIQDPESFFVAPFNADGSYLLDKILGIQSSGARMPLGGTPLNAEQTDLIRNWILEGAANN
jgi:hypothetical protein